MNTLKETIQASLMSGPMSKVPQQVETEVFNFIREKFKLAYKEAESPEELQKLKLLQDSIVGNDEETARII